MSTIVNMIKTYTHFPENSSNPENSVYLELKFAPSLEDFLIRPTMSNSMNRLSKLDFFEKDFVKLK